MIHDKKYLKKFNEYRNVDFSISVPKPPKKVVERDTDPMLDVIFAPDPITHVPCSDLGILTNRKARPEVAQYINEHLAFARNSVHKYDTADNALEFTLGQYDDRAAFKAKMQSIVQDAIRSTSSDTKD